MLNQRVGHALFRYKFLVRNCLLALTTVCGAAQTWATPAQAPEALGWDNGRLGTFALLQDRRGDVWAATEDKGVWRYTAADKQWTQYSVAQGLGNDTSYALAQDRKGRMWAGTLRNSASV